MEIDTKQYIDQEIDHLEEKVALLTREQVRALKKASLEIDRRLEGMNEFREQLNKQASTFITRDEYQLSLKLVEQKITNLSRILYIGIGIFIVLEVVLRLTQ